MEFSHRKNYYTAGIETLFGEQALRINVTIERETIPTSSKYRKLVVVVPRKFEYLVNDSVYS
jgi:hypothetical protein